MNMHLIQPLKWYNLTKYDRCDSIFNVGVLNLNGAIPTLLTNNIFTNNFLDGSIPLLPNNLQYLYLYKNQLSGCIPLYRTV